MQKAMIFLDICTRQSIKHSRSLTEDTIEALHARMHQSIAFYPMIPMLSALPWVHALVRLLVPTSVCQGTLLSNRLQRHTELT